MSKRFIDEDEDKQRDEARRESGFKICFQESLTRRVFFCREKQDRGKILALTLTARCWVYCNSAILG